MNNLEFRAWLKKEKKLVKVLAIDFQINIIGVASETLVDEKLKPFANINGHPVLHFFSFDDCVIEQYTGLKDKNGKKIYEGDIVLLDGVERTVFLDSVTTGAFRVTTPDLRDDCEWHPRMFLYWYYEIVMPKIKVIGNIHENPELLGKE